jgi:hypothetical protein
LSGTHLHVERRPLTGCQAAYALLPRSARPAVAPEIFGHLGAGRVGQGEASRRTAWVAAIAARADFANHVPSQRRTAYEGHVAQRRTEPRGPGRPPLPELTLTAPKTTPFTPEQRAQFVAPLTDMIVNYRQEQHLEQARAAAAQAGARLPEEPPGQSPAP